MPPLTVLLIGAGGREHALAWSLARSPLVHHLHAIPGNGGLAALPKTTCHPALSAADFPALVAFAEAHAVTLVVPGPEQPLVDGIADYFEAHAPARIKVFGPSRAAAEMEGSKAWSKAFMQRWGVPTAQSATFAAVAPARAFLEAHRGTRWVLKADGLAAGKGVLLPATHDEAVAGLESIMVAREFGGAGATVVIEEFLEGEEISILTLSDGHASLSLPAAQDHKRAFDGDQGPNTGGMGAYAPAPCATKEVLARIERECIRPTIEGMRKEGRRFVGCLFTGFMLTKDGPKVLEYNVRFGDPETQALLPLLENDLAEVMWAAVRGELDRIQLQIRDAFSTCVVVAAGGYPGSYAKDTPMTIQPPAADTEIFHAGTTDKDGVLVTAGGRVIAASAIGSSIEDSVTKAYAGVECIRFEKMQYRKDIAHRALHQQPQPKEALTYASTGVSISAGNDLVALIKPLLKQTARPGIAADIGGFGGEIHLSQAGYPADAPTILAAIDGIGTKLLLGAATGIYDTLGIDLVAMNANDLVVQGAEPLAFLDYYACGALDVPRAARFVAGVVAGCQQAGCGLVGGETAEMPGVYAGRDDWDAGGCCIGALPAGRPLLPVKGAMRAGDALLALGSSGCHSNGFSLVRRVVERSGLAWGARAPWEARTLGEALLEPTRIYVKPLLRVLAGNRAERLLVKGLAHITGGGLLENVPRMLPGTLAAAIEAGTWEVPGVLRWLKREGALANEEFARVLNAGLGMVMVVEPGHVEEVTRTLEAEGEKVYRIGRLVPREGASEGCEIHGMDKWDEL